MTDKEAFIAAICQSPEDHIVRLIFADWLDEFGDGEVDSRRASRAVRRTYR